MNKPQIPSGNYLQAIETSLQATAAANSEYRQFDKQIAASLAWSLASRYQYFYTELMLLDHPRNPRRARTAEALAERTRQLETTLDETLGLLSVVAAQAPGHLLPTACAFHAIRPPVPG
jgi:biopolymer transport protein ExbB/TolQ